MGILDRIILTLYTLFLAVLSVILILLSLSLLPMDVAWTSFSYFYGHWEFALIGGVFFLISVRLLLAGIRSQRGTDNILHKTEMGDVLISLDAVKNLVEKTARMARGARAAKVYVSYVHQELKVRIKMVVSPDSNVPEVAKQIQHNVRESIAKTVGIELSDVEVYVNNISNDFKPRQRVE